MASIKTMCRSCSNDSLCSDCHHEILEDKINMLKAVKYPNQFKHQLARQKKKLKINKLRLVHADCTASSYKKVGQSAESPPNITILQFMQDLTAANYSYGSNDSYSSDLSTEVTTSLNPSDFSFDELFL